MKPVNPTDDELNAAFAEKVCGWKRIVGAANVAFETPVGTRGTAPEFTKSADAVLPWLIKFSVTIQKVAEEEWDVGVEPEDEDLRTQYHHDKYLARACAIALLRAHGVEIEFTHA